MENEIINKKSVYLSTFHKFKNEITDQVTKLDNLIMILLVWIGAIQILEILIIISVYGYK